MSLKWDIIDYSHGNNLKFFWKLYQWKNQTKSKLIHKAVTLLMGRCAYRHRGYVGATAVIQGRPILPHGLQGIYISRYAQIGKNCCIYQNVTIGEVDKKAPVIGDNCLIGAGAVLIGNIRIGSNVKIGAGAVVSQDVPDHCTVVSAPVRLCSTSVERPIRTGRNTERTWIEINLENLEHNVRVLQQAMPQKCKLMAVVKTRAYGHGAVEISSHLNKIGVEAFAVATIDEGIELRKHGIRGEILILGYTSIERVSELKKYDLMQTLIDFDHAAALNEQNVVIKAHIKIDTGMHRLGIDCNDYSKIKQVFAMKNIEVCGIYTHLCCSESLEPEDVRYTKKQIRCFYDVIEVLKSSNITIPKVHIQSSYGLLNYPNLACDYARIGIALYGVLSSSGDKTNLNPDLRPVLSLKTRVVLVRQIRKGDSVGYDRKYRADRDGRIAVLPIGYGDGLPRNLSCQKGSVYLNGRYVPIVGQICMDQLAVDVTNVNDVSPGDVAVLIGADNNMQISAPVVSACSDSISNELLCRIGERVPVVIV